MNFHENGYIFDDLDKLLLDDGIDEIVIDMLRGTVEPERAQTQRILKCLGYWASALPRTMEYENVKASELASFQLRIKREPGVWMKCIAEATNDRGKSYAIDVLPYGGSSF